MQFFMQIWIHESQAACLAHEAGIQFKHMCVEPRVTV